MKYKLSCIAVALIAVSASTFAADTKPSAASPLTKVNGVAISSAAVDLLIAEQTAQGAPNDDQLKRAVREELVRREVISQEARKKGLDKKAEVTARADMARQAVLVGAYLDDWAKANKVKDTAVRAEYDTRIKSMPGQEYHARHILVEKEDEAQAIIKKLQSGAKFADLAKESKDPGSKENGGDLGWNAPNAFVPAFSEAMVKLAKGTFTPQPVKTNFGYHVILLEDSRKLEPPKFEEVKDRLTQAMMQQAVQSHITELVKKAKVEQ